jgi:hypothetical protein
VRNKNISILISIAIILTGSFFIASNATNKQCVGVYVDYGVLDSNAVSTKCVEVSGQVNGLEVLSKAGILIEGTDKYGMQIVCRVNSLPSATRPIGIKDHEDYVETCAEMPATFAYWAVIVKKGALPWGWADTGIDKVMLKDGDSVGLVFAENDNVRFPE